MSDVLAFWLVAVIVGTLALPISFALLRRFPDGGAGLSFALGLVLAGYGYFILRVVHVLPPGRGGYLLALVLLGLVSAGVAGRDRRFVATLRRCWPACVTALGVFSFFFFLCVAVRSYNADITGTEQPMDLMFLNATMTSPNYPPHDPWLAGERISYYYFGYLQAGLLTSVAGVPSSTGYNLSLAYTFGAAAAGVASLAFAIARWVLGARARRWAGAAAALAVVLLLFVGSLSAVFEWSASRGYHNTTLYERAGLEWLLPCTPETAANPDPKACYRSQESPRTTEWYPTRYWFWFDSTRVIPDTITEFPFFSFLLGDLHPHVMSIPLVLLSLGLAAATWRGRRRLNWQTHRANPWPGLGLAVVFGGLAFQNAWDVLTFTGFLVLAVVARNLRRHFDWNAVTDAAGYLGPILVAAIVLYVPWYRDFSSQAGGLLPYVRAGTRPEHAFLQFGPLLMAGGVALTWAFRGSSRPQLMESLANTAWLPLLPILVWGLFAAGRGEFSDAIDARGDGGWVTLAAYGVAAWLLAAATLHLVVKRKAAALVPALLTIGVMLLLGGELFFIKDVFAGSVPRLNTVFKLSYQAWIILSVGGAVALVTAARRTSRRESNLAWLAAPAGLVVLAGLVYPIIATANRTEGFGKETAIDGLAGLARSNPDEYALTRWMQDHTDPGDIIIEASGRTWRRDGNGVAQLMDAGNDYSNAGRISERTGRQTPLGWYFHEIQWRGQTAANAARFSHAQDMVDRAYLGTPAEVLESMRLTGAKYLVVGASGPGEASFERTRYGTLPDYASFLDVAFEAGDGRVYTLPAALKVQSP